MMTRYVSSNLSGFFAQIVHHQILRRETEMIEGEFLSGWKIYI